MKPLTHKTLRAFDTANGAELWEAELPVGTPSAPVTYTPPNTGKQYNIITAGGARQSPDKGDSVIAMHFPSNIGHHARN